VLELKVLQAVRLKGRISTDDLAATIDEDDAAIAESVDSLTESGLLIANKTVRLSAEGRGRLAELLSDERASANLASIAAGYDEFKSVNSDFKALVSAWQLRDGEPNDHQDAVYDRQVLERLQDVHERVLPIIATVSGQLPRVGFYADKLERAYVKVRSGDTAWLTRPIVDSYHTVWFELHEELIVASGLTREQEAAAGHAQ
jgi:hypothetical protein